MFYVHLNDHIDIKINVQIEDNMNVHTDVHITEVIRAEAETCFQSMHLP